MSGEAQQYTSMPVMHFHTCRLLCDMGYQKEMLEIAKEKKGELFESYTFIIACVIMAITFIYEYSIFHRSITYIAPILMLPLLMITLQREQQCHKRNFKNIMFLFIIILLVIACTRGSLCGLKFFVL